MSKIAIAGNNSGTATFTIESPATSTNRTLTLPDTSGTIYIPGTTVSNIQSATAKSATGTSVDFTGIPSWVKRITVMFRGVSTSGTSNILIQLGDAGGIENTGYASWSQSGGTAASSTAGFIQNYANVVAANTHNGIFTLCLQSGTTWVGTGIFIPSSGQVSSNGGPKALSDVLTQVRITTVNGTDTFDAGTINILYE